jgi:hypothetical protein
VVPSISPVHIFNVCPTVMGEFERALAALIWGQLFVFFSQEVKMMITDKKRKISFCIVNF